MSDFVEDHEPTFENTYLLAWYDSAGKGYLTTWDGDLPIIHVVVTGCNGMNMPLWDAPVPHGAKLHSVPEGTSPGDYAKQIGGYHAFGWRVPVKRKDPKG